MTRCVSCGDGPDRICARCNRDLRRERMCPLCLAPIERRQEGRRVTYVHPEAGCLIAERGPWFYHGKATPYLVTAGRRTLDTPDMVLV